jgi:hypothetical protein
MIQQMKRVGLVVYTYFHPPCFALYTAQSALDMRLSFTHRDATSRLKDAYTDPWHPSSLGEVGR